MNGKRWVDDIFVQWQIVPILSSACKFRDGRVRRLMDYYLNWPLIPRDVWASRFGAELVKERMRTRRATVKFIGDFMFPACLLNCAMAFPVLRTECSLPLSESLDTGRAVSSLSDLWVLTTTALNESSFAVVRSQGLFIHFHWMPALEEILRGLTLRQLKQYFMCLILR